MTSIQPCNPRLKDESAHRSQVNQKEGKGVGGGTDKSSHSLCLTRSGLDLGFGGVGLVI